MKRVGLRGERLLCAALLFLASASTGTGADGPTSPSHSDVWSDYRAIIWHPQKAGNCAALKELGIDAGMVMSEDRDRPAQNLEQRIAPLRDCGLTWYVENIATDFYSAYHRYSLGKPANWRFVEIKRAYQDDPQALRALMRDPSLSDPEWQKKIRDRLSETVRAYRAHRPLFYNLADEPGIADLSAFWDFDLSPRSLVGMRRWLKGRYRSLAALNHQWGSSFADWNSVVPMTTAEAMKRSDGNYSAWADFKEWMDVEFARAINRGTAAIHNADPGAYSAIEGGQIPGWGGYDYARLANAVDLMELYDGGGNLEIVRSLNPKLVVLKTSSDGGTAEIHGIWRSLLRGGRGVILWDPERRIVDNDGRSAERGTRLAPVLREIKSGLGALLIHSKRRVAPVAVLYSPPSMRVQWMLDWQPRGTAWSDRGPSEVYEDENRVRSSMTAFFDFLGHVGLEPRVLTHELIEKGALDRDIRVLILPRVLALSKRAAAQIQRFSAQGGAVIADGIPGSFDEHGRRLATPLLAGLFRPEPRGIRGRASMLELPFSDGGDELMKILAAAGVEPAITLTRSDGSRALNIQTQRWRNGATTILALQRDADEAAEPEQVLLTLRSAARIYDLRTGIVHGTAKSLQLTIDPVVPTVLALSASAGSTPAISGASRAVTGGSATITFNLPKSSATGFDVAVLRVELIDPDGKVVPDRSANILVRGEPVVKKLSFGKDHPLGRWQIHATDVLTGNSAWRDLEVVKD